MSLDIYLYDRSDQEVISMNWLRNPFGLIYVIQANTGVDMWGVINDNAYDNSHKVNRKEFLSLAQEAFKKMKALTDGFFLIPVTKLKDGRQKDNNNIKLIKEKIFTKESEHHIIYKIRWVDYFEHYCLRMCRSQYGRPCQDYRQYCTDWNLKAAKEPVKYYKDWTGELLEFATELQNPEYDYYCSN